MKKFLSVLISAIILCGFFVTAHAANELAGAANYTLGSSKSGSIVEDNEKNIYKFALQNAGKIDIRLNGGIYCISLKLYDAIGKEIWSNNYVYWNSTTEEISYQTEVCLCKGTYYFSVSKNSGYGTYAFTIEETAIYESFSEEQNGSNNTTKTANVIAHGENYIGCIALNDEVDVYKMDLLSSGKLALQLTGGHILYKLKVV